MGRIEDHKNYRKIIQNERKKNLMEDFTTVEEKFVNLLKELESTQDVEEIMNLSDAVSPFVEAVGEERAREVAEQMNLLSTFESIQEE